MLGGRECLKSWWFQKSGKEKKYEFQSQDCDFKYLLTDLMGRIYECSTLQYSICITFKKKERWGNQKYSSENYTARATYKLDDPLIFKPVSNENYEANSHEELLIASPLSQSYRGPLANIRNWRISRSELGRVEQRSGSLTHLSYNTSKFERSRTRKAEQKSFFEIITIL